MAVLHRGGKGEEDGEAGDRDELLEEWRRQRARRDGRIKKKKIQREEEAKEEKVHRRSDAQRHDRR
jgi:hypothetical protein